MKSLKDLRTTLQEHDMGGDHVSQVHTPGYTPPNILILKRKTVRAFSSTERVALYYSEKLGRYFSVPYTIGQPGSDDVVGVTEEHQIGNPVSFKSSITDKILKGKVFKVGTDHLVVHVKGDNGKYGLHHTVKKSQLVGEAFGFGVRRTPSIPTLPGYLARKKKKAKETQADKEDMIQAKLDNPPRRQDQGHEPYDEQVAVETDTLNEISIPTATRAFHARDKRGIEALQKKDYKTATFHFKKAVKTLDHRAKKYAKSDAGLAVEGVIQEDAISHLRKVKEFHTNTPLHHKDGTHTRVDPTTAHALLTVHDAMNPDNQKKYADALEHSQSKFHRILDFAWKQVK